LAKYPASTVQILGAEKALFRALKNRTQTPKYGLIYNSSFITKAKTRDKGRISRYLANKCVIASRIDAFSDVPTTRFGETLKQQVLDRLKFYDTGEIPRKNIEVMHAVVEEIKKEQELLAIDAPPPQITEVPETLEEKIPVEEMTDVTESKKHRKRKSSTKRK